MPPDIKGRGIVADLDATTFWPARISVLWSRLPEELHALLVCAHLLAHISAAGLSLGLRVTLTLNPSTSGLRPAGEAKPIS